MHILYANEYMKCTSGVVTKPCVVQIPGIDKSYVVQIN